MSESSPDSVRSLEIGEAVTVDDQSRGRFEIEEIFKARLGARIVEQDRAEIDALLGRWTEPGEAHAVYYRGYLIGLAKAGEWAPTLMADNVALLRQGGEVRLLIFAPLDAEAVSARGATRRVR